VTVRILSWLSIACIAISVALVVFGEDNNTPVVAVLVLAALGITSLLALRAGYLKARGIVSDASSFISGNVQNARLVSIGDPKGIFWPKSSLHLELEGDDGNVHPFEREVPVPFFMAWTYRLGKRFNLPLMRSTDLSDLMAFQLRREGMSVSVERASAKLPAE
jgi:hypothetical protein